METNTEDRSAQACFVHWTRDIRHLRGKEPVSEHNKLRVMEGLEWELELDWLWPGKMGFWSLALGLSHWE